MSNQAVENEPEYLEIVDGSEYQNLNHGRKTDQRNYGNKSTKQKQTKIVYILLAVVIVILIFLICGVGYIGGRIQELSKQFEEQKRMTTLSLAQSRPVGQNGSNQPLVAFFAMRNDRNGILTGSSSSVTMIKYPEVITNAGGDYDADTGYFTVPMNGLYSFTFTVQALGTCEGTEAIGGILLVDGEEKAIAYSSRISSGAVTAMLQLQHGQRVAIGIHQSAGCMSLNLWGNSFSGFLVQAASV